jgi:hypothetical protein
VSMFPIHPTGMLSAYPCDRDGAQPVIGAGAEWARPPLAAGAWAASCGDNERPAGGATRRAGGRTITPRRAVQGAE